MRRWWVGSLWLVLLVVGLTVAGCSDAPAAQGAEPAPTSTVDSTGAASATAAPSLPATVTPVPTEAPAPVATATPFVIANPSEPCGVLLPVQLSAESPLPTTTSPFTLPDTIPDLALPAVERLLDAPHTVGLVAYQVGHEADGVFLNADVPMPLASVVKLIHLVAYVRAVEAGELDPVTVVPLAEIEAFYLPGSDLGAHRSAVALLDDDGRLLDDGQAVLLRDVPWMMMRTSSNAATDYLHHLLGQTRIEQTVLDLGLEMHSAPCSFIGRFLLMGNHSGAPQLDTIIADPTLYGEQVAFYSDTFSQNPAFRSAETRWGRPIPSARTQRAFTAALDTVGTARSYADLMARITAGPMATPFGNALLRSYLEWPLEAYERNQAYFSAVGFKNGSLPGVLTTAYYGYRWDSAEPIVVALFYRDLPLRTYQRWRRSLPHDELAHWLLRDPAAIATLRDLLQPPANGTP